MRSRVLGFGAAGVLAATISMVNVLPGCGGDTNGTGPDDVGSDSETGPCGFSASFVSPTEGQKLGLGDDLSGKKCADGLVADVKVATNAPDGKAASLYSNDAKVGTATVAGSQLVFSKVAFPSKAATVALRISFDGEPTCASVATESISIDCGLPACAIETPKGPYLNGRPVADGGDRVNDVKDPFATAFVITTDIEDGQTVTLTVDGDSSLKGTASGGKAAFGKVTLAPDGFHTVSANCQNAAGNVGGSGPNKYDVHTGPVTLTVTQPTDGKAFGIGDDVDLATPGVQFKVCGTTTTADAIDVPADAKLGQKNFCAAIGTATALCDSMHSTESCVTVTCPDGSAPFEVNVVLSDKAGNQAKGIVKGVRCESKLPSVQIVAPIAYDAAKPSTILNLAAGETGSSAGSLKKTVIACTDKAAAKAQLLVGKAAGTLTARGAPVDVSPATGPDGCPSALGYVARISTVLPESDESSDGKGTLATATEIRVDVTDSGGNTGKSPAVDLWVDSVPPVLTLTDPFCGKTYPGTADVTSTARIIGDTLPFTYKVTGSSSSASYVVTAFDVPPTSLPSAATLSTVKYYLGASALTLTAKDAAGNSTDALSSCTVYVGSPPVIAITSPADGSKFGFDTNVDLPTSKYKMNFTGTVVGVTSATSVTLKVPGDTTSYTAPISAGAFTFTGILVPEGEPVTLTVSLVDTAYGTVSKSESLYVDTHVPSLGGSLTGSADATKRRAGGVALSWTAGSDFDPVTKGTRTCDHYEARKAATAITNDATWAAATVATSVAGTLTSATILDGRLPVNHYWAVRCVDAIGNKSPVIGTSAPVSVDFIEALLAGPGTANFGKAASGAIDFNSDGVPDLVVGSTGGKAHVYFGHKPTSASDSGYPATPSLTLTSTGFFGFEVAGLDDFDGDGTADLAISAPVDNSVYIVSGKAITASSSDVAVTSLGTNVIKLAADTGTTSLGARVFAAGAFGGTSARSTVAVRAFLSGNPGLTVVKGRAIDGSTVNVPSSADFTVRSPVSSSLLGYAAGAQDLDGDGLTDLVLGDGTVGAAYVFKGRALPVTGLLSTTDATSTLTGLGSDNFGWAVSLPGSIGAKNSLVVCAPAAGRIDVASSSATTFSVSTSIANTTGDSQLGVTALFLEPGRTFDVDKDGESDVLVCSNQSGSTVGNGKCYMWYGQSLSPSPGWTTGNAQRTFALGTTSFYAGAVTSLGDIDADGYVDFVVCSPGTTSCRVVR